MAALVDPPTFYAMCPSQSGADSTGVTLAIFAASTAAERYCGRSFAEETTTEYYDGTGYPEVDLKRWPISAVASVYLDVNGGYGQATNAFPVSSLLTAGTNYVYLADSGKLQTRTLPLWWPSGAFGPSYSPWGYPGLTRHGAAWSGWPKVPGCIKVTYTAGYNPIPSDLQAAVCAMASYILTTTDTGGLVSTTGSYIDVSVGSGFLAEQLARGNVPALGSARAVLDSYRDWKLAKGPF